MGWRRLAVGVTLLVLMIGLVVGCGREDRGEAPEPLAQEERHCSVTVATGESIQAAIDGATPDAVICLEEGEWEVNLTMSASMSLVGQGPERSVLRGSVEGLPVIRVVTSERQEGAQLRVSLEEMSITGASGAEGEPFGLLVEGQAEVTVRDCHVHANARNGVGVTGDATLQIESSAVRENAWTGIYIWEAASILITDSTVSENGSVGLVLEGTSQATIRDTEVRGNRLYGMYLAGSAQATITGSTVANNGWDGIDMWGASSAVIESSTIAGNEHGITLRESAQLSVEETRLTGNRGYGVLLDVAEELDTGGAFAGFVGGKGNVIPGPGDPDGNESGGVSPEALSFLLTEEGGEFGVSR